MRFDLLPKKCHVLRPDNLLRLACIFIVVLAFAPGRAMAQGIMVIDDTSAFEGSSGTTHPYTAGTFLGGTDQHSDRFRFRCSSFNCK